MNLNEIFYYFAPIIGSGTLLIGIFAMVQPEPMSKKFGIAVTGAALPYVRSTGARDVFIGIAVLILFFLKDWLALGYINLSIGIVAIADFWVVQKHGDRRTSLVHLFGAGLVIIYGAWLISH